MRFAWIRQISAWLSTKKRSVKFPARRAYVEQNPPASAEFAALGVVDEAGKRVAAEIMLHQKGLLDGN